MSPAATLENPQGPAAGLWPVARLRGVTLRYRDVVALDAVDLDLPGGCMVGLIGPDGVGKSSLLGLVAGSRALQTGQLEVLGGDLRQARQRRVVRRRVAYMPQGLGRNLYPTLTVWENLEFFGRLRAYAAAWRHRRMDELLDATGLSPFRERQVMRLSGGMKQKLGLCCALLHDPDLLILDEPTTGVDPLSRSQFWDLIHQLRSTRPDMSVVVATSSMDEAEAFDWLVAMDAGRPIASGSPTALRAQVGAPDLEQAFIALLPPGRRQQHQPVLAIPRVPMPGAGYAIEASALSRRFGAFVAVDRVDLRIERGEIFGFIGSNGCGKTTTMKMLTGLLAPSEGRVLVFGREPDARDLATRARVGYMTQGFSLYTELTVRQNLDLHARLFGIPASQRASRVLDMSRRFGLESVQNQHPLELPLGMRQRLSLAVAMIHKPDLLILDEPTSGVDPIARDWFWQQMISLARDEGVTIFVSTHMMHEAARCDRVALMHAGRVLATGTPQELVEQRGSANLEQAFVAWIREHDAGAARGGAAARAAAGERGQRTRSPTARSVQRLLSYAWRESLELLRDPVRSTLALVGTVLLMVIMGYGINLDVEHIRFAVLDRDHTALSRGYVQDMAASRDLEQRAPLRDLADLDSRMRRGDISLAVEIPEHFARDLQRGVTPQIAAWVDGSMPSRAETIDGYVQALHATWLQQYAARTAGLPPGAAPATIEVRFRYNPDVRSLVAMVPALIPLLLIMIPAMLAALSVVREKELGSMVNFYVTPVARLEFLLGKQLPYVVLGMLNFLLLWVWAVGVFKVPFKGSFATLTGAAWLYVMAATALGLLMSSFLRTQTAAIFATTIGTALPAVQFCGLLNPTSSLEGLGAWVGRVFPTTYFLEISRGTFSKALGFSDVSSALVPLALATPVLIGLSALLLRKQER